MLFRSGSNTKSAIDLANEIIAKYGGKLATTTAKELMNVKGVGYAKATSLVAAIELCSRLTPIKGGDRLNSPSKVYDLLINRTKNLKVENFFSILLNTKNEVINIKTVSIGTVNKVIVHPRDVYSDAIKNMASSIIVAHNHPSGDSRPSREDIEITKRLMYVGEIVGIKLLDHIVIGNGNYTSLKEEGLFND